MKYKIRSLFIPTKGFTFLAFDLSQAETWIVAYRSREQRMKDALLHSDIHTITASAIFAPGVDCDHDSWMEEDNHRICKSCNTKITNAERYLGKRSNHGNSYRMSAERWTQVINADSDKPPYVTVTLSQAKKYRNAWLGFYPGVTNWWKDIESQLARDRTITTTYGRKRNFTAPWGDSLFKEATAYEPQSTVADHALGLVHPELGVEGGLLGICKHPDISRYCNVVYTAHDSVIVEAPKGREREFAPLIYRLFRRPLVVGGECFTIPVDGEIGDRWGELERIPKSWYD